jgi:beta-glucosidase
MLAFYDENFDLVIEPGRILVMIGSSSEDIRMQGAFEITGDRKMMIHERIFICPTKVES